MHQLPGTLVTAREASVARDDGLLYQRVARFNVHTTCTPQSTRTCRWRVQHTREWTEVQSPSGKETVRSLTSTYNILREIL